MAHRLAPEAEADLDELWYYVATNGSVEIADRLVDSLTTRFFLLGRYPRAGRRRDDLRPGTRSFSVGGYLVFYRLDGEDALIQRVVRGSRELEPLLRP
jgi:plasmid stabilization system protein ParE